MASERSGLHLPYPAQIDAYGEGGFRFAGMSHRGSILCLPAGVWAVAITAPGELGDAEFDLVAASEPAVEHLLIGTGRESWLMPGPLRARLRAAGIVGEAMSTRAAVHTYNQLLAEGRRVGALLISVD